MDPTDYTLIQTPHLHGTNIIHNIINYYIRGYLGRDRMVVGLMTTYMQSVPITTNVVNLNPSQARCTQYNIM